MKDTIALARNAEVQISRRLESLRKEGASAESTAMLEALLDYAQRYLAGERGELADLLRSELHYTGLAEGMEVNGTVLAFSYAIKDEYDALHGKADAKT